MRRITCYNGVIVGGVPGRRSALGGEELRVALLDAAGRLLTAEGPHALSTRRLADAVGTSTQAIYTLFGGKDGLVRAMYREGFVRLMAQMEAAGTSADPLADLFKLGLAYRAAALASPHLYDVMMARPVAEFVPSEDDRVTGRATLDALADAVRRTIDAGAVRGDVDAIALHLWIATHGFVSLELAGYLDVAPDEVDDAYRTLLVHALTPFLVT